MNETDELAYLDALTRIAGIEIDEIVLATRHQVLLGSLRVHYLDWGNEAEAPVIFLHGGSLTAHMWDLTCLALRTEHHCIAPDLRGHGDSEWPGDADYRLESFERDLVHLIDFLGYETVALVGMSWGGLVALQFAGNHPDRLSSLCLVDVGPDLHPEAANRIVAFVQSSPELESVEEFVELSMKFNPRRDRATLRRSLLYSLRQLPNGRWTWKWDPRRMRDFDVDAQTKRQAKLWQSAPKTPCPVLIVRGERSQVFTAADAAKLAASFPAAAWVEVEGAGHSVHGDNPSGLLAALQPFLSP